MRRLQYDAGQAAKRLKVSAAQFRWARHTGLIPDPDLPSRQWSRTAVETVNAGAVRAAMPTPPVSGSAAADRIAAALGTPNAPGQKAAVTAFVVRRLVDRGLLTDLSTVPDATLHHPGQVDQVRRRKDPAAADTPPGPEQAAARLGVRRGDVDRLVRLGRIRSPQTIEIRFGTSRTGAVDVPLYTTADIDTVITAHPEIHRGASGEPFVPAGRAVRPARRPAPAAATLSGRRRRCGRPSRRTDAEHGRGPAGRPG